MGPQPQAYIVTELFAEEAAKSNFGPVDLGIGIEVSKIMRGAGCKTDLTFLPYALPLGRCGKGPP